MEKSDKQALYRLDPQRWYNYDTWLEIYFAVASKYAHDEEAEQVLRELSEEHGKEKFDLASHITKWNEAKKGKDKQGGLTFASVPYWIGIDGYKADEDWVEKAVEDSQPVTELPEFDAVDYITTQFNGKLLSEVDEDFEPEAFMETSFDIGLFQLNTGIQLFGKPDIGKTWISLYCIKHAIDRGGRVIHFDKEGNSRKVKRRLKVLGLRNRFENLIWQDEFSPDKENELHSYFAFLREAENPQYSIVVFDSNMMWGGQNYSDWDEQSKWYNSYVKPFVSQGNTVFMVGHSSDKSDSEDYMGTTALRSNPDQVFILLKDKKKKTINPEEDGFLNIKQIKDRDGLTGRSNGEIVAQFQHLVDTNTWGIAEFRQEKQDGDEKFCSTCEKIRKVIDSQPNKKWEGTNKELYEHPDVSITHKPFGMHIKGECKNSHISFVGNPDVGWIAGSSDKTIDEILKERYNDNV